MNDRPRAAIHVGEPSKSFSAAEGNEPERRGWDEKMYRQKMLNDNNHYDFSRKKLNFEINTKGEIVPLGSNPIPLDLRIKLRLSELGFKPYKGKDNPIGESDNSPNFTVGIIISGDHDVLAKLAFGDQDVDYSLERSNGHIKRMPGIELWAMDTCQWACKRWGKENIIGFDVHLDETTVHIHLQMIPVAMIRERGRKASIYVMNDNPDVVLDAKAWKSLPKDEQSLYTKTETERKMKECVSYGKVWGENKWAVSKTYSEIHTEYYDEVGYKYGLDRGDVISMLPENERHGRVHKSKAILEAERQSKEAIRKTQDELDGLKSLAYAAKVEQKELDVPNIALAEPVQDALRKIQAELDTGISLINYKKWPKERKTAIKKILTEMQDILLAAKGSQKAEIQKLGKAIYKDAQQRVATIVTENRWLRQENEHYMNQNVELLDQISKLDSKAVESLRKQKDAEISQLKSELSRSQTDAAKQKGNYLAAEQRADKAEKQILSMLSIPQIKEIWEEHQRQKANFTRQLDSWVSAALKTIHQYTLDTWQNTFNADQERIVCMGILAKTMQNGKDGTSFEARSKAVTVLLSDVDWRGSTPYGQELCELRVNQLNEELSISSELMNEILILAAGGHNINTGGGGGGSDNDMLHWDGLTQDDIERAIYHRAKRGKRGFARGKS